VDPQLKIEAGKRIWTLGDKKVVVTRASANVHYIGRKFAGYNASTFGNPFFLPKEKKDDVAVRQVILEKYKRYFYENRLYLSQEFLALQEELLSSGVVTLGCWCSPAICHGDIIAQALLGTHTHQES